jgi:Lipopolysaccharide-assembly
MEERAEDAEGDGGTRRCPQIISMGYERIMRMRARINVGDRSVLSVLSPLGVLSPRLGLASLVILATLPSAGCGYALAGRGSFLPEYIMSIGVPAFANRTTVFNLETVVTQKVRAEFIGRGKFKILPQSTDVDALLVGDILSATLTPVSFSTQQIASRYALTVAARIELRDVRENKVLWENPSLLFRQEYEPQTGRVGNPQDVSSFFGQDANALERMSTDFARTIVSSILEAF